jgi:hypothetical protein
MYTLDDHSAQTLMASCSSSVSFGVCVTVSLVNMVLRCFGTQPPALHEGAKVSGVSGPCSFELSQCRAKDKQLGGVQIGVAHLQANLGKVYSAAGSQEHK